MRSRIFSSRLSKAGFTLIEMLLVVATIAIIAGIVILAINPSKQLADARNSKRRADVQTILNAVYQYSIDASGTLPSAINIDSLCSSPANEICQSSANCSGSGLTDLSVLTNAQKYVTSIPYDPQNTNNPGTSYYISKNSYGRVTVCAPLAEQSVSISVTR